MTQLKLERHAPGRYTVLSCPLPAGPGGKCGAELHYEWSLSAPVYLGDVNGGDLPSPDEAWSGTWAVTCLEGHVILVPAEVKGCDHGDGECPGHDEDTDEAMRTVRPSDLVRLREVLLALGPVVDLAGVPQILTGPLPQAQPAPCPDHQEDGSQLGCEACGQIRRRFYEALEGKP